METTQLAEFLASFIVDDHDNPVMNSPCWRVTPTAAAKRGRFRMSPKLRASRRSSYTLWVGSVPDDMEPETTCWIRHCIAPDHLVLIQNEPS